MISSHTALDIAQADDAKTDREAYFAGAILLIGAMVVNAVSAQADHDRIQQPIAWWLPWLFEGSSAIAMLMLIPALAWWARKVPLSFDNWARALLLYFIVTIALSLVHVGIMVAIRKAAFTLFLDHSYVFASAPRSLLEEVVYEYRKDVFTFVLFLWLFSLSRDLAQSRRETAAARDEARNQHRLTLKCGGRIIFVDALSFLSAKAAGNYVELKTKSTSHLARMTLTALQDQLSNAGIAVARCHRSHIVNTASITQITPNKNGNATLQMENGDIIPVSSSFKDQLKETIYHQANIKHAKAVT